MFGMYLNGEISSVLFSYAIFDIIMLHKLHTNHLSIAQEVHERR